MKISGTGHLVVALLLSVLVEGTALARDVYKGSLDPGIPRHRAVLATLSLLEANPKDAGLKNDLGCLIAQEGFWRDALREFDEAADLDLKDGRPLFNAGLVKATRGEWRGARSYFQRATKRDGGNWPAWWMLGFAQEQLGNTSAAVAAYKVSLRVDTSLFDVAANPFAGWTQLKMRVFLESYEVRRVRVALPTSEQWADSERVTAFFQKTKKGAPRGGAPAPTPTPEPKSGPVVSKVPEASTVAPRPAPSSGPSWNPQGPGLRRRDEARPSSLPPRQPVEAPPTEPTPQQGGIQPGVIQPTDRPGGEGAGNPGPASGVPVPVAPGPGGGAGPGGGQGLGGSQSPTPTPAPN